MVYRSVAADGVEYWEKATVLEGTSGSHVAVAFSPAYKMLVPNRRTRIRSLYEYEEIREKNASILGQAPYDYEALIDNIISLVQSSPGEDVARALLYEVLLER